MDSAKELLVSVPAWGIFAFLVIKVVLDFIAKRDAKAIETHKAASVDEIAAVLRDQAERKELLETVREQAATQLRIAEALEQVARAQERMSDAQERHAARSRAMAESIASTRQSLDRLLALSLREEGTPNVIPIQQSSGHRTG